MIKKILLCFILLLSLTMNFTHAKAEETKDDYNTMVSKITANGKNLNMEEYNFRYNNLKKIWAEMGYDIENENLIYIKDLVVKYIVTDMINDISVDMLAEQSNISVNENEIKDISVNFSEPKNKKDKEFFDIQYRIVALDKKLKKNIYDGFTLSKDEALNYYNENIEEFKSPDSVRASHILVETKEEALNIYNLLEGGNSFEDLAKTYSIDTESGSNGGDIGIFEEGAMDLTNFDENVFGLEVGKYSEVFETEMGWHIVKVTEKYDGEVTIFDSQNEEIMDYIKDSIIYQKLNDMYNSLDLSIHYPDGFYKPETQN